MLWVVVAENAEVGLHVSVTTQPSTTLNLTLTLAHVVRGSKRGPHKLVGCCLVLFSADPAPSVVLRYRLLPSLFVDGHLFQSRFPRFPPHPSPRILAVPIPASINGEKMRENSVVITFQSR